MIAEVVGTLEGSLGKFIRANCLGREKAIAAYRLAIMMGVTQREVRQAIANLRKAGNPISSSVNKPYGFYWPADAVEGQRVLAQLSSRLREISAAAKGIERGLREQFGAQRSLKI